MKQLGKILAPTDLSEFSKIAVRYALTLAHAVDAEVTVYHVVDYKNLVDYESLIKEMKGNTPDEGMAKVFLGWLRLRLAITEK